LKTECKQEYDDWVKALSSVISNSYGYKKDLEIKESDFNIDFWRFDHIEDSDFM
jgi:hypothetical protein